ncbi:MAG: DUF2835 family protein [Pseudomonadota bacterium]
MSPSSSAGGTRRYTVEIVLTAQQIENFYAGQVSAVWVRDIRGVAVQFPLSSLRQFVGHNGVHGRFVLTVGSDNRLVSIARA